VIRITENLERSRKLGALDKSRYANHSHLSYPRHAYDKYPYLYKYKYEDVNFDSKHIYLIISRLLLIKGRLIKSDHETKANHETIRTSHI